MTNREYMDQYPQLGGSAAGLLSCLDAGADERGWTELESTVDTRFFIDCLAAADGIKARATAVHGRYRRLVNKHFPKPDPFMADIQAMSNEAVAGIAAHARKNGLPVPDKAVQDACYYVLVRYVSRLIPAI